MAAPEFSLRDFNIIATGKYNAGLIDFGTNKETGKVELVKVNDHISKKELNNVKLSPERILEVKESFLDALRRGGVDANAMKAIRAKLGVPETLSSEYSKEGQIKMIYERFRPLSRQEVRDILDKYANSGSGVGEARRHLSLAEAEAQVKTTLMPKARKALARETTALSARVAASYDYSLSHALALLTDCSLSGLNKKRTYDITGPDAENRKQASADALRNQFTALFDAALKLSDENVREAGPLNVCGQLVRLVKSETGSVCAKFGSGALETTLDLRIDASAFLDRLVARAIKSTNFLGGAKVFKALDGVFDRDASGVMTENDRASRTRQFAAAIITQQIGRDFGMMVLDGSLGPFNTGILVKIAEHVLDGNNITMEDLQRLADQFKDDVAQLPDDLKEMLAKVVQDRPVEIFKDNKAEFVVKETIVAPVEEVAAGNIPPAPPIGVAPRYHTLADIKNFVADLVFSDETLVADVTINRPGETMRKMLSDDVKLSAFAEILRNPALLDLALSPKIAGVVKEGFAKLAAALDADFRAANDGESLEEAAKKDGFTQRFSLFFKNPELCKGATLARFDDILLRMSKKGCEEIQAFINLTFKIDGNVQNEAGGLTTDPYKNKTAAQIKEELKAKSLNDIMSGAATDASVPGQVGFFKQVLSDYFIQMSNADKRNAFASAMRYADTFDFRGKDENGVKKASTAATAKFVGAILKGTGPLLQKMMQGIPRNILAGFSDALADMKCNLAPIPRKIVQAHLYKMIQDSNGKIKSITLKNSLGAASVGEAFLCEFKYLGDDGKEKTEEMVVKIMRHDAEERVEREAKLFEAAAVKIGPGMKKTWEGQYEQYKTEFDFRNEANNVNEGVRLYDVVGNNRHFAKAIAPNVSSMKISPLVAPTKNAMVCTLAGNMNADQYFKDRIARFQESYEPVFEKDPATGRIKWDPATKKPVFKKGVGFMDMQILLMFLDHEYEQILKGQKNLQQAAQLWFHQAFLGSGKFHGDAHSGNIMLAPNRATFIDFGNMYELKVHYELGEDGQPVMEEVTETNEAGEKVKVMRPKVRLNERVELLRLILGATLRSKDFFLAGFEKLLSPAGRETLAANRDKAEAIVETILEKGQFSFDVCYRLQGALSELQKLGLEMPPQINCFVQSMTRLQNTMAEMNTILNQMRVIASTVKNDVPRASAEEKPDELDIIGTFDYMSRTDAGLQPEQAFEEDEQDLLYVMDEDGEPTDKPINVPRFVNDLHRITFQCDNGEKYGRDGEYELKVAARLRNSADPAAEALKIAHYTVDRLEDGRGQTFLKFAADFKKAWDEAKTPEEKEEAIKQFAHNHVSNTAMALRQKSGSAQSFYTANLEAPGGFAGVVMSTLFAESDAASEMLEKNFSGKDQGKILASMKIISVKELGAGIFAGAGTIMNAIVEDTKKLGGDDSYQIDVGV